ncbi:vomeronasal type-2 receptor 26-like [Mantella aurantiaca]
MTGNLPLRNSTLCKFVKGQRFHQLKQQLSQIQRSPSACNLKLVTAFDDYEYVQDGDVIIGGTFTVNNFMTGFRDKRFVNYQMLCLRPNPLYFKYFLTIRFAIEEINKSPMILPNITLGYHMYDSCNDNRKAVKSVLQILSGPGRMVPNYSCRKSGKLVGFIGDQSSETTVNIAQLLALYRYSQISYGATSNVLNKRDRFPTFFRTVQGNEAIYTVISSLVQFFGWKWVGVIFSDDESGNEETQLLTRYLTEKDICVDYKIKINHYTVMETIKNIIDNIRRSAVQVIILCGTLSSFMADLLNEINLVLHDKTLVFGPTFASSPFLMEGYNKAFNGSLAVGPILLHTPDMNSFYGSFQVINHPEDTLLGHLWLVTVKCSVMSEFHNSVYSTVYKLPLRNCSGTERVTDFICFKTSGLTDRVYSSVECLAHAVHDMLRSSNNIDRFHSHPSQLHYWIKHLRDNKDDLLFDINGEFASPFEIANWVHIRNNRLEIRILGKTLAADLSRRNFSFLLPILWKTGINMTPKSLCTESCLPGTRKVPKSRIYPCCYDCVQCSEGEISNVSDSKNCQQCRYDEWPNEKKDRCILKQLDFLSYSNDVIGVIIALTSVVLCATTGLIFLVFISHQDTAIVKANNRNLSFTLLVSIMLSFLCVFFFLGRPEDISCLLRQISFGIFFTIALSCVLAKTIMVCLAFKATKPGSLWQHWIGAKLSQSIVILCSSIQVIICVAWLSTSPPFHELDISSYKDKIIIQCNEGSVIGFYSVLGYMGFLAAVSFALAFMVRTLPDSFNEAKYITFSMLVFCSVWITMIPAYLSTKRKYMVAVEIFAILSSSAGVLGCLFLPKCYIILWRSELNTKTCLMEKRFLK